MVTFHTSEILDTIDRSSPLRRGIPLPEGYKEIFREHGQVSVKLHRRWLNIKKTWNTRENEEMFEFWVSRGQECKGAKYPLTEKFLHYGRTFEAIDYEHLERLKRIEDYQWESLKKKFICGALFVLTGLLIATLYPA